MRCMSNVGWELRDKGSGAWIKPERRHRSASNDARLLLDRVRCMSNENGRKSNMVEFWYSQMLLPDKTARMAL